MKADKTQLEAFKKDFATLCKFYNLDKAAMEILSGATRWQLYYQAQDMNHLSDEDFKIRFPKLPAEKRPIPRRFESREKFLWNLFPTAGTNGNCAAVKDTWIETVIKECVKSIQ